MAPQSLTVTVTTVSVCVQPGSSSQEELLINILNLSILPTSPSQATVGDCVVDEAHFALWHVVRGGGGGGASGRRRLKLGVHARIVLASGKELWDVKK